MIKAEHIFVFCGPTLTPQLATKMLDAVYLPPVKLGDIYRICKLFSPRVIGIIDGYFNQVPAVWHKEIHYALSQGIQVYGAASMGALRAAEMDQLGMQGCGEIYRAYRRGSLKPFDDEPFEDDDEVAVIHGPAELNYLAASDALVNIRFSLAAATKNGIIDQTVGRKLALIAKRLFYARRRYATVLKIAYQQKLPKTQLRALEAWLKDNYIDQKHNDAITLLEQIAVIKNSNEERKVTRAAFETTSQWQAAIDEIDRSHFTPHPVVNELRLQGDPYFIAWEQALNNDAPLESTSLTVDPKTLTGLHGKPLQLNAYLSEQWCRALPHPDSESAIRAHTEQQLLKMLDQSGALQALKKRAKDKQITLAQQQHAPRPEQLSELDRLQLCDAYFSDRLSTGIPDHPEQITERLGFLDEDEFYAMLLAEYLYTESRDSASN